MQDVASQWVAELVEPEADHVVLDVCAAPGGKSTWMAHAARHVVAGDARPSRTGLIVSNARRTGAANVSVLAMDARASPLRTGSAARVLVDAPCSGLGVLARRPDARWRMEVDAVDDLAQLQREILDDAARLVAPGGYLVYSVCTLTSVETVDIDVWLRSAHPEFESLDALDEPWQRRGRGALLLPQAAGTDGMYLLRLRRS